jgi:hypothetical protein
MVVPPVSLSVSPSTAILRNPKTPFQVTIHLASAILEDRPDRNRLPTEQLPTEAVVKLRANESIHVEPSEKTVTLPAPGKVTDISFQVTPLAINPHQPLALVATASFNGKEYAEGFRAVGYPGILPTNYYTPATLRVVPVDVTTAPNLNIAYIPGTGDDVPTALEALEVSPHILTAADLTPEALKPFDAVVLGVRAYERRELAAANPALNAYAAAGGIVIAQYNTGRLPEGTGPYPLDLGGSEKVVEEDAPVHILAPDNPLLTWPNKITTADFDHWVEERGHGFMATWDPHYTPLLETHDHGQQPQLGGLLVARTGRGAWIYLGLALYRQLPEGVPGPYRLFANLISAARNPGMQK